MYLVRSTQGFLSGAFPADARHRSQNQAPFHVVGSSLLQSSLFPYRLDSQSICLAAADRSQTNPRSWLLALQSNQRRDGRELTWISRVTARRSVDSDRPITAKRNYAEPTSGRTVAKRSCFLCREMDGFVVVNSAGVGHPQHRSNTILPGHKEFLWDCDYGLEASRVLWRWHPGILRRRSEYNRSGKTVQQTNADLQFPD